MAIEVKMSSQEKFRDQKMAMVLQTVCWLGTFFKVTTAQHYVKIKKKKTSYSVETFNLTQMCLL